MVDLISNGESGASTRAKLNTLAATSPLQSLKELPGLQLWLAPESGKFTDAGTTPATDGQAVYQWNDQSGNGNHCVQTTLANRPLQKTNRLNGLSSTLFDGSNDYLSNPYVGDPGTIIVVFRHNSYTPNYQQILGADTPDAVNVPAYAMYAVYGAGPFTRTFARATTNDTGSMTSWASNSSITKNVWEVYGARATGQALGTFKGAFRCGSTVARPAALRPVGGAGAAIGCGFYNSAASDFASVDICEVAMWNTPLSDDDYRRAVAYLENKYAVRPYGNILGVCFQASSADERLYGLQSPDGLNMRYKPMNYQVNSPVKVRDPSIIKIGSTYWMAHTNGYDTGFDIASSPDAFNWTFQKRVDTSATIGSGAGARTWAPEWFVDTDGTVRIYVSCDTTGAGLTMQLYELRATDPNNLAGTWTAPVALAGTGLPARMIDPFMIKIGSTYYCWYKRDNTQLIEYMSSTNPITGYTLIKTGDWAGWGANLEGQCLVQLADRWRIYLDLSGGGYYYSDSFDNWATWTAKTLVPSNVPIQHATLIIDPTAPTYTAGMGLF